MSVGKRCRRSSCRESEGVPRSHIYSPPKEWGPGGLTKNMETVLAGFSLRYPPRELTLVGAAHPTRWIPASAGMTEESAGEFPAGVLRACRSGASRSALTQRPEESAEGRSPFAEGLGVSPNSSIFPQEWGPGG